MIVSFDMSKIQSIIEIIAQIKASNRAEGGVDL